MNSAPAGTCITPFAAIHFFLGESRHVIMASWAEGRKAACTVNLEEDISVLRA